MRMTECRKNEVRVTMISVDLAIDSAFETEEWLIIEQREREREGEIERKRERGTGKGNSMSPPGRTRTLDGDGTCTKPLLRSWAKRRTLWKTPLRRVFHPSVVRGMWFLNSYPHFLLAISIFRISRNGEEWSRWLFADIRIK